MPKKFTIVTLVLFLLAYAPNIYAQIKNTKTSNKTKECKLVPIKAVLDRTVSGRLLWTEMSFFDEQGPKLRKGLDIIKLLESLRQAKDPRDTTLITGDIEFGNSSEKSFLGNVEQKYKDESAKFTFKYLSEVSLLLAMMEKTMLQKELKAVQERLAKMSEKNYANAIKHIEEQIDMLAKICDMRKEEIRAVEERKMQAQASQLEREDKPVEAAWLRLDYFTRVYNNAEQKLIQASRSDTNPSTNSITTIDRLAQIQKVLDDYKTQMDQGSNVANAVNESSRYNDTLAQIALDRLVQIQQLLDDYKTQMDQESKMADAANDALAQIATLEKNPADTVKTVPKDRLNTVIQSILATKQILSGIEIDIDELKNITASSAGPAYFIPGKNLPILFANFNGKPCLIIVLVSDTIYNTSRLTKKEIAAKAVSTEIIPTKVFEQYIQWFDKAGKSDIEYCGVMLYYGSRNFLEEKQADCEMVCILSSKGNCKSLTNIQITDQEFLDKSEIYTTENGATYKTKLVIK